MTNPKAGQPDMVEVVARLRSRKGEAITRTEKLMNEAADLITSLQSQLEAAERERDDWMAEASARLTRAGIAEARAAEAEAKCDAMREALRPFADIADLIDSETEGSDDTDECQLLFHDYLMANFKVAQFRAARKALENFPCG